MPIHQTNVIIPAKAGLQLKQSTTVKVNKGLIQISQKQLLGKNELRAKYEKVSIIPVRPLIPANFVHVSQGILVPLGFFTPSFPYKLASNFQCLLMFNSED